MSHAPIAGPIFQFSQFQEFGMCIQSLSAVCVQRIRLCFEDPVSCLGSCSIVLDPVDCSRPFRMMWDIAGVVGPCRIL